MQEHYASVWTKRADDDSFHLIKRGWISRCKSLPTRNKVRFGNVSSWMPIMVFLSHELRPVHTIYFIHTSSRYHLFIQSTHLSAAFSSSIDSDWVKVFLSFISWKKNISESDSNDIISLCLYCYSRDVDF